MTSSAPNVSAVQVWGCDKCTFDIIRKQCDTLNVRWCDSGERGSGHDKIRISLSHVFDASSDTLDVGKLPFHMCFNQEIVLAVVPIKPYRCTSACSLQSCDTLPSLLFPDSSLWYIKLLLSLNLPVDADFFLKMREALTLSQKCDLRITTRNNSKLPFDIDIEDLRTRLLFPPTTNVQTFEFQTVEDECLLDRSPFFDALFKICHPKHVYAKRDMMDEYNNHFCSLSEMTTGTTFWSHHLKAPQKMGKP
ncbi:unnamed protein product [Lactuca virosa]|uniref:BTB domain-containing protein n=1 Tax=Lactuca virosa TaxID=75947 RepID=A0AAU9M5G2_9ASTR|nr:unnamed protein product [Lactuca virosa]